MSIEKAPVVGNDSFAYLLPYACILLTTFRKDGRAVPTIVSFAPVDGKLYVTTDRTAGKTKRIRNSGRVTIAPCTQRGKVLGETIEAQARELPESEHATASAALERKMGPIFHFFVFMQKLRKVQRTYLEITPASA